MFIKSLFRIKSVSRFLSKGYPYSRSRSVCHSKVSRRFASSSGLNEETGRCFSWIITKTGERRESWILESWCKETK